MRDEKILIVEDDEDIVKVLNYWLSRDGYQLRSTSTGEDALRLVDEEAPDLVILDLTLPGIDGLEVARHLRSNGNRPELGIIMLTARTEESDVLKGFGVGADDYVSKPFSPRVLTARVRAVLRGKKHQPADYSEKVIAGKFSIHAGYRQAYIDGVPLNLTFTEFEILHLLAQRAGWVFTRSQIIDAVRGKGYPVSDRSVDAQVFALRKKLREYRSYIETVRSVGYRFVRK